MKRTAAEILKDAQKLPSGDRDWLVQSLLEGGDPKAEEEFFASWRKNLGKPDPGYEQQFRAGVEEALADTSPGVPHEVVVEEIAKLLRAIRGAPRLKASCMKVIWGQRAKRDLHKLVAFIAEDSVQAADRVASRILNAAEMLSRFPRCGRIGRVPGTRERVVRGTPYILV